MDLEAVRQLVTELDFDLMALDATIRTPLANASTPTRVIWMQNLDGEPTPIGTQYAIVGARRRMAVQRGLLTNIERGTLIEAPEPIGGASTRWQVDGTMEVGRTHFVVAVVAESRV